MTGTPHLHVHEPHGAVGAVALVLHGGRSNSTRRVRASQLAVLRMLPFAASLRRAGVRQGLAVAQLRFTVRGWNGAQRSPVADAQWALGELRRRFPDAPVALVGHSMGGRAAVYAAGFPTVRAVVGLAPWIEDGDPVEQLAGRRILFAHGEHDRMTSPRASAAFAQRAARVAESVSYVSVEAERHAMLRRARVWHELVTGFVLGVLCGTAPEGTAEDATTNVVGKALAGQAALVV
ncbi:MAG: alpha/beta hydrolase [Jatrophihabitantaceae bacterium]